MAGVKGAKLAARAGKEAPRKHYCSECKGDGELTSEMEMKPTMFFNPKKSMIFKCKSGHEVARGGTILA